MNPGRHPPGSSERGFPQNSAMREATVRSATARRADMWSTRYRVPSRHSISRLRKGFLYRSRLREASSARAPCEGGLVFGPLLLGAGERSLDQRHDPEPLDLLKGDHPGPGGDQEPGAMGGAAQGAIELPPVLVEGTQDQDGQDDPSKGAWGGFTRGQRQDDQGEDGPHDEPEPEREAVAQPIGCRSGQDERDFHGISLSGPWRPW